VRRRPRRGAAACASHRGPCGARGMGALPAPARAALR
jgi:hypothetical protein